MTRRAVVGGVVALALGLAGRGGASDEVTVRGEVVDIQCATSRGEGGRGLAHAACALDCAKHGLPLGILADDALYEIAGDFTANHNAKLLDFVAKVVVATGELTEQDGTKRLNVRTIRAAPR
mgnify:CR=1 FL=1